MFGVRRRMYRLSPDCWVRSPRPSRCLHPQPPGSLVSGVLSHQEEEEEEEKREEEAAECSAVCCHTAGCDGVIRQAAGAQCSTSKPTIHTGSPSGSGLTARGPGAPSSQQPEPGTDAERRDPSQHHVGGCCREGLKMESQGCVCLYGQREPECLGPCWPGPPYVYYGVRRSLVVGVEVVEEVAVEDTIELITEDIYTDDLLMQDEQLYPT
uniref:uncharacterized protein LOC124064801 isoform X2 n=1 Tax=Scatophagus argus TaxID=75038 RepID=UPI001ED85D70|nr:uncharacterized protein LOC124064801 isoform X2 [Scatophagus argus]